MIFHHFAHPFSGQNKIQQIGQVPAIFIKRTFHADLLKIHSMFIGKQNSRNHLRCGCFAYIWQM
jgi:hypothetical protein